MNKVTSILIIMVAMVMASCGGSDSKPQGAHWGHTEYYEDHLFKKYEPVVMSNELEIELNNDAARFLSNEDAFIKFQISSDSTKFVRPKDIIVYFNDTPCPDFTFCMYPKKQIGLEESEITNDYYLICGKLGIEFKDEANNGGHHYYVLYDGCKGKNQVALKDSNTPQPAYTRDLQHAYDGSIIDGIYISKETVENPAAVIIKWIITIILIALAVWFIVFRNLLYPKIRVSCILFTGPGHFSGSIRVKGCYKVVLTADKNKKQGILSKIFIGKILYVRDDIWTSDIVFSHFDKNSVAISVSGNWSCSGFKLCKYNYYEIKDTKNPNNKGTISVN
ncbi:MAG: hypothetical protein IIW77_01885 [Bacteroidaceae bacterium]|nr:hypothetical protein [Bacteroidaceae bacterium]